MPKAARAPEHVLAAILPVTTDGSPGRVRHLEERAVRRAALGEKRMAESGEGASGLRRKSSSVG